MREIALRVTGLDCAVCAPRLDAALAKLEGVESAATAYAAGVCRVVYDEEKVSLAAIERRVCREGFSVPEETAELYCPGLTDETAAEALRALRGVFGVRDAARSGEMLTVRLSPVGVESRTLLRALRFAGVSAEVRERRGGGPPAGGEDKGKQRIVAHFFDEAQRLLKFLLGFPRKSHDDVRGQHDVGDALAQLRDKL